jgi:hypothetical protein
VLYEEDIDQLRNLSNLNDSEKEIVRRLFVLGFKSARKEGREDQIRAYQQLLTRLQLNQPLEPSILVHEERLRAYVSITFEDCFVISESKLIRGTGRSNVANDSRSSVLYFGRHHGSLHTRRSFNNVCSAGKMI